ncbi:hypothetical protein Y032_0280g1215 [Ancylostoma ceylanicum]|uniref:Uncharacterized protein n=1 Tax=Ancylostoma ceylanicum TaxID=53326 RepID=A0A016S6Q0_9BILA|nr:hypothetical protein Y032_0280g1215 [Ancylostoma ceylanicum]
MDGSPVDASDIEVEVARDTEPPSDYYSLDTTLFFETVELHDERPHLLKTVNGETIRINPSEEVDVDAFLPQYSSCAPLFLNTCNCSSAQFVIGFLLRPILTNKTLYILLSSRSTCG